MSVYKWTVMVAVVFNVFSPADRSIADESQRVQTQRSYVSAAEFSIVGSLTQDRSIESRSVDAGPQKNRKITDEPLWFNPVPDPRITLEMARRLC